MKLKRAEKSAVSSEVEVQDICIGTEDSYYLSGKESEIQELHAVLDHLKEEKEELEERVAGLDEVVQDREGTFSVHSIYKPYQFSRSNVRCRV